MKTGTDDCTESLLVSNVSLRNAEGQRKEHSRSSKSTQGTIRTLGLYKILLSVFMQIKQVKKIINPPIHKEVPKDTQ